MSVERLRDGIETTDKEAGLLNLLDEAIQAEMSVICAGAKKATLLERRELTSEQVKQIREGL